MKIHKISLIEWVRIKMKSNFVANTNEAKKLLLGLYNIPFFVSFLFANFNSHPSNWRKKFILRENKCVYKIFSLSRTYTLTRISVVALLSKRLEQHPNKHLYSLSHTFTRTSFSVPDESYVVLIIPFYNFFGTRNVLLEVIFHLILTSVAFSFSFFLSFFLRFKIFKKQNKT